MMNYFMVKIVTLAAILFLNGSPWVTEVDKYYVSTDSTHSVIEVSHPANESVDNYCYVKGITEETDENGVTWTVYHCGANED